MKHFIQYLTEDSDQIIRDNSTKIQKRMLDNGFSVPAPDVHSHFKNLLRDMPEHHKNWIAKRYADGGIKHVEDISKVSTLLKRHDELLAQNLITPGALKSLKNDADLFSMIKKRDPKQQVQMDASLVKPEEYTVTGANEHWTEITPHTENAACQFGKGTNWCTASESNSLFNHYNKDGPMHILIPKNPVHSGERYQIHPQSGQVMNERDHRVDLSDIEKNGGRSHFRMDLDDPLLLPEPKNDRPFPTGNYKNYKLTVHTHKLAKNRDTETALSALNDPNADAITTQNASEHHDPRVALAAVKHPKADALTTRFAAYHTDPEVGMAAIQHPKADLETTFAAARHPDTAVATAAMEHPLANGTTINKAAGNSKNSKVAIAALEHPLASIETLEAGVENESSPVALHALHLATNVPTFRDFFSKTNILQSAVQHHDPAVVLAALKHPDINTLHLGTAAEHRSEEVRLAALKHPKSNQITVENASDPSNESAAHVLRAIIKHPHTSALSLGNVIMGHHSNSEIQLEALDHPKVDDSALTAGAARTDPTVALKAVQHPKAGTHALEQGVRHHNATVGLAALRHRNVDSQTIRAALASKYNDPAVALEALKHPLVDKYHLKIAAGHENPEVVMAALQHPKANEETVEHAIAYGRHNSEIAMAALQHPKANAATTHGAANHFDPAVALAALKHPLADEQTARTALFNHAGEDPNNALAQQIRTAAGQKLHLTPDVVSQRTITESYFKSKIKSLVRYNLIQPSADYITEDYHQTLRDNQTKIAKRMKDNGFIFPHEFPHPTPLGNNDNTHIIHSVFNRLGNFNDLSDQHKSWIAKRYADGGIEHAHDLPDVIKDLKQHDELVAAKKIPSTGLKSLSTADALRKMLAKFGRPTGVEPEEYKVESENEHWSVVIPHTSNASCGFADQSKWCTNSRENRSQFEQHTRKGPLRIIIPKNPQYKGEKYQWHQATDTGTGQLHHSFMNRENLPASFISMTSDDTRPLPPGPVADRVEQVKQSSRKIKAQLDDPNSMLGAGGAILSTAVRHSDPDVAITAVNHTESNPQTIEQAMLHPDLKVAKAAINNSRAPVTDKALSNGIRNPNPEIALHTLQDHRIKNHHVLQAMEHSDPKVLLTALSHPALENSGNALALAARSKHKQVVMAALKHPKADPGVIKAAINNPNPEITKFVLSQNPNLSSQTINEILNNSYQLQNHTATMLLSQPNANTESVNHVATNSNHGDTLLAALQHPLANALTTHLTAQSNNSVVALSALKHPLADALTTQFGAQHQHHADVALAALQHPLANAETVRLAARNNSYGSIPLAALRHPLADTNTTIEAADNNSDREVSLAAIFHPKASQETLRAAQDSRYTDVAESILRHPLLNDTNIINTIMDHHKNKNTSSRNIQMMAVKHPNADTNTTHGAARSGHADVAVAALESPHADATTVNLVLGNPHHTDPLLSMLALKHKHADAISTHLAVQNRDPEVALAALAHPHANAETTRLAARHLSPIVRLAAINSPHADSNTIRNIMSNSEEPEMATAALNSPHADRVATYEGSQSTHSAVALAALAHHLADARTTHYAARHHDPAVNMAALKSPHADATTTHYAVMHGNEYVAKAALNSPNANTETANHGLESKNMEVVMAALGSRHANAGTTHLALSKTNKTIALAGLASPHADEETTRLGGEHNNPEVVMAALAHPLANAETTYGAADHRNPIVAMAGVKHPKSDTKTTHNAAHHDDPEVAMAAVKSPHADATTTHNAVVHKNQEVSLAALASPHADAETTHYGAQHEDPNIAMAAIKSPHADATTTLRASGHRHPEVAMAAVKSPHADLGTINNAAKHNDLEVSLAALRSPHADARTTHISTRRSRSPVVALEALKHKHADAETAHNGALHDDPEVALAALKSPHASAATTHRALAHQDSKVALAAVKSPHADAETTHLGVQNTNSEVGLAALAHSHANEETTHNGAQNRNLRIAMAALASPHANARTTHIATRYGTSELGLAAMASPHADEKTFLIGAENEHEDVRLAAARRMTDLLERRGSLDTGTA